MENCNQQVKCEHARAHLSTFMHIYQMQFITEKLQNKQIHTNSELKRDQTHGDSKSKAFVIF